MNGSSLTTWFTEVYVGGSTYGLGNANVDGFYLDDNWHGAPSEEAWSCSPRGTGAGKCAGLSKDEIGAMDAAWQHNMDAVQTAIVDKVRWQHHCCYALLLLLLLLLPTAACCCLLLPAASVGWRLGDATNCN